jgi:hypothetical protein
MAKLIVGEESYESVAAASIYERTLELLYLQHAPALFPWALTIPFKRRLQSPAGNAEADLALIDRGCRKWWLIEVELSHHDLFGHVVPQVASFAEARFSRSDFEYLADQCPSLDKDALSRLVLEQPPEIHVVVDRASVDWERALRTYGATLGVCEIFRSARNRTILRLNGHQPSVPDALLSLCRVHQLISRGLVVVNTSALAVATQGKQEIDIEYDGGVTRWRLLEVDRQMLLLPNERYPLHEAFRTFELLENGAGPYILRPAR